MQKSVGEVVDLRPQTFQQQHVPAVIARRLPGLYPWLRFGSFFTRDDWIGSFGIDLESIDEKAANAYVEGESAFFEPLLEDYVPALGKERVLEIKQRKLETFRLQFIYAATKLCGSPIEQLMLAGLPWIKYGCKKTLVEIWDPTSHCAKPQTEVVIAPQYQIGHRVDFAIFVNVIANEEIKIAIECDGHFHEKTKEQAARDKRRNRHLEIAGWRPLRFTGSEIWWDHKACTGEVSKLVANEIEAQLRSRGLILDTST
jgi:very-short-patch-repair endonuclease